MVVRVLDFTNSGFLGSKLLGGSEFNSTFHLSEVDQMQELLQTLWLKVKCVFIVTLSFEAAETYL